MTGRPAVRDDPWGDYLARGGRDDPFERQWQTFLALSADRDPRRGPLPAWVPDPKQQCHTNVGILMAEGNFRTWEEVHGWSVRLRAAFWATAIRRLGIVFRTPPRAHLLDPSASEDPVWLPGASLNIADSCLRGPPEVPAIHFGREGTREIRTVTRGELEVLVNRFANGLRAAGLGPGSSVALYMPLNVECIAAYLGIVRAGCRAVSIADSFPAAEVARRLEIGGAGAIVTATGYRRAGKWVDLYAKVREAGAPATILTGEGEGHPLRPGDRLWKDFLSSDDRFESEAGDPGRVTNVLFSSGTTGTPKAIPWTHLTPIKAAVDGHFHLDIGPGDVVAWPTNIGWMMGPWLVYASLINGAAMAIYEGGAGEASACRFLGDAGVTILGVVPSLVRGWRSSGATEGAGWNRIRLFSSTGEASHREDFLWLMSRVGYRAPIIEYCGGTEIGGGYITGTPVQPASPGTFTTAALGIDFDLLDEDGSEVAGPGTGEVFLRPPSIGLSQSLLNADHHAVYYEGVPRGPDGAVLRRHGDAMERLPGGFYRARGRVDDTMKLGGIKVSALEIEHVVALDDRVSEAAAVAVRDHGEGADRLVLFVVPRREADPDGLRRDLARRIHDGLNPLFKVHDLVLVESLPRTASHKLLRRELRARYVAGHP